MKSVGTLVSEPKEKKQSHERDKEVSKSWSFNITSIHFFHAISYLCFNILLLGTITNLLAKNVGKVKGCLRWRHGRKEKKKEGDVYASINLFSTSSLVCFLVMGPFSFRKCLTWIWGNNHLFLR